MPLALRAGGGFLALSIVLVILTVVSVFSNGLNEPFAVTTRTILILIAAVLLGVFATVRRDQPASRAQVIGLGVAVGLLAVSMLVPQHTVYTLANFWLIMYAAVAALCAVILRRKAAT